MSPLPGRTNYLSSAIRKTGIQTYRRTRVQGVYPGIDLEYYGNGSELEYDWLIGRGVDPNTIRIVLEGANDIHLEANGDLRLRLASGAELIQRRPVAYQERNGVRIPVACDYHLAQGTVRFKVGHRDRRLPLVIDPVLSYSKSIGGSGTDMATGVAVDKSGNIFLTGTAGSFDFPVVNAIQDKNQGTRFAVSTNSGGTWSPLPSNLAFGCLVADSQKPTVLYSTQGNSFFRSIDGGTTWNILPVSFTDANGSIVQLQYAAFIVVNPKDSNILYVSSYPGPVLKSTDAGATWAMASNGIPSGSQFLYADLLVIDPFHPEVLYTDFDGSPYKTTDGGNSWAPASLPNMPSIPLRGSALLTFDPVTPNVLYSRSGSVYRSTDGGATWVDLGSPFGLPFLIVPDPSTAGVVYGATNVGVIKYTAETGWQKIGPGGPVTALAVDPSNSRNMIAVNSSTQNIGLRTTDGGGTWTPVTLGRPVSSFVFDRKQAGLVYACTAASTDAFVTKLNPAGDTVLFSTYLGGVGAENATAIALDAAGNIYIAGYSGSFDFPTTPGAFQASGSGPFVASLTPNGDALRYATFIGAETNQQLQPPSLAVTANGEAIVAGTASPAFLRRLNASGTQLQYSTSINGAVSGMAFDSTGSLIVAGAADSGRFVATPGAFQTSAKSAAGNGFVARINTSGNIEASTFISGSGPDRTKREIGADQARAVAVDPEGNILVTGVAVSPDFPITTGPSLQSNCSYAFSCIATFLIGSVCQYHGDDIFVSKLDASLSSLKASRLLGGACYEGPSAIALDASGNVFVAGNSNSIDFPVSYPFESGPSPSNFKGVVAEFDSDLSKLIFASYADVGNAPGLAANSAGDVYVSGFDSKSHVALLKLAAASTPRFSLDSITNAFNPLDNSVSPGMIASIKLSAFKPVQPFEHGIMATDSGGSSPSNTRVLFDGVAGLVLSVSENRIEVGVPRQITGTTRVQVEQDGVLSNALTLRVALNNYAFLTADGSGSGQALAWNEDGALNSASNPAAKNSTVTLLMTGAGEADANAVGAAFACQNTDLVEVTTSPQFVAGVFVVRLRVSGTGAFQLRCGSKGTPAAPPSQNVTVEVR